MHIQVLNRKLRKRAKPSLIPRTVMLDTQLKVNLINLNIELDILQLMKRYTHDANDRLILVQKHYDFLKECYVHLQTRMYLY